MRWAIEEVQALQGARRRAFQRGIGAARGTRRYGDPTPLAIRLIDVTILDNKAWWGGADIRLDMFVVHGGGKPHNSESYFAAETMRCPSVPDGGSFPLGDRGKLVFHGEPAYFIDFFLMASRDRKGSDNLVTLLKDGLNAPHPKEAIGSLLAVGAVAVPEIALITAAIGGAATLGSLVYEFVQAATPKTVGLYHGSYLQEVDDFGIGPVRTHVHDGLRFSFEVVSTTSKNDG